MRYNHAIWQDLHRAVHFTTFTASQPHLCLAQQAPQKGKVGAFLQTYRASRYPDREPTYPVW